MNKMVLDGDKGSEKKKKQLQHCLVVAMTCSHIFLRVLSLKVIWLSYSRERLLGLDGQRTL